MLSVFRTFVAVLACALVAVALNALPTLADTPLGHSGTVGAHSLHDTASSPGVTCNYGYKVAQDAGKLVKLVVAPPRVHAAAGNSAQEVGWRFTVQRRVQGIGGATPWVHRYTSPEMTAVTDDAHNAAFTSASVPVIPGAFLAGGVYQYRVLVSTTWHGSKGGIMGKATNREDFYVGVLNTGGTLMQNEHCDAWRHAAAFT
jgi:hypothetical protein